MEKLKEIIAPSIISSVAAIGIYKFVLNEDLESSVPLMGSFMPAWQVLGVSSLVGSVAGEFLSDVIIPKIPKIEALGTIQDIGVPPAITGLTTYGSMRVLISEDTSFKNSFLLGASSSIVGKYVYTML